VTVSSRGLASATVIGPFNPGDDRDPQLHSGVPAAPVEHVLLQQAEEALIGRMRKRVAATDEPDLVTPDLLSSVT
jgi:hypothetical protein